MKFEERRIIMARILLSKKEIIELSGLLKIVFFTIKQLKEKYPLAAKLRNPQIPSQLSESLAYHKLNEGIISELRGYKIYFGNKRGDSDIVAHGRGNINIEIKASGDSAFQNFQDKDTLADYIVWIHFGAYFLTKGNKGIDIFTLKNPGKYFKPGRITLKRFIDHGHPQKHSMKV